MTIHGGQNAKAVSLSAICYHTAVHIVTASNASNIVSALLQCCTIIKIKITMTEIKNNFPVLEKSNDLCRGVCHYRQRKNNNELQINLLSFYVFKNLLHTYTSTQIELTMLYSPTILFLRNKPTLHCC